MTIRLFTQGDLKHLHADERALLVWFVQQFATGSFGARAHEFLAIPTKRRIFILNKWDERDGWNRYHPTYVMALAALAVCEDETVANQINDALARANVLSNQVFWPGLAEYDQRQKEVEVQAWQNRAARIANGTASIDEMLAAALGQAIDNELLNGTGGY